MNFSDFKSVFRRVSRGKESSSPLEMRLERRAHIIYTLVPLNLQPLLDADLCLTYGAEGTMARFLLAGVPQLIAPWQVEAYMAAAKIESRGLGRKLGESPDTKMIIASVGIDAGGNRYEILRWEMCCDCVEYSKEYGASAHPMELVRTSHRLSA